MTLAAEIERLRDAPSNAPPEFDEQIRVARQQRERLRGQHTGFANVGDSRGIDRSKELNPVVRPAIVRALTRAE